MKTLNLLTLILVIFGGIDLGLVGLFHYDLISAMFGVDTMVTRLIYALIGLAAVYQLIPFVRAVNVGEVRAEAARY